MEDICSICGSGKFVCPKCNRECYFCHIEIKVIDEKLYAICLFCEEKVEVGIKTI